MDSLDAHTDGPCEKGEEEEDGEIFDEQTMISPRKTGGRVTEEHHE